MIGSGLALYGLGNLAAMLRFLPERDPHPDSTRRPASSSPISTIRR